jgi:hypothetical protein
MARSKHPSLHGRRAFLEQAAWLPLAAATGVLLGGQSTAAAAPIKRAGGAHLKTALNAYSFADLLTANLKDRSKGLDLFQLCDYCAEQGFEAVDLTGYFFPGYPGVPEDSYVYAIKRHAFDRGLAISGTGVRNDFTSADKAVRSEGVQRVKAWIEVAARLGAPVVRVFVDSQPPFKNWREASRGAPRESVEGWVADAVRECAEHGQAFGGDRRRAESRRLRHDRSRASQAARAGESRLVRGDRRHGQVHLGRSL